MTNSSLRSSRRGVTAVLVVIFLFALTCLMASSDGAHSVTCHNDLIGMTMRYYVIGTVISDPSTQIKTVENLNAEILVNVRTDYGSSGIMPCISTECADLMIDQRVEFSCWEEMRRTGPVERGCRLVQLLPDVE